MTPDLLAALRETPGCGGTNALMIGHGAAANWVGVCDRCMARFAEGVAEQLVAAMPAAPGWSDGSVVEVGGLPVYRSSVLTSLLTALRRAIDRGRYAPQGVAGRAQGGRMSADPTPDALLDEARELANGLANLDDMLFMVKQTDRVKASSLLSRLVARIEKLEALPSDAVLWAAQAAMGTAYDQMGPEVNREYQYMEMLKAAWPVLRLPQQEKAR